MGRVVGLAQGHLQSIEITAMYAFGEEGLMAESVVPPSAYYETISGKCFGFCHPLQDFCDESRMQS